MTRSVIFAFGIAVLASPACADAIHDAVKAGDLEQVKMLIDQGEDINKLQAPLGTALHFAAVSGSAEIAALLLAEGAEVNRESNLGTPLKVAAMRGSDAVALVLIEHGADVLALSGGDGTTPLHAAARGGHASMVELLIERGADVNARSVDAYNVGYTPAHSAGEGGHYDIVDLLRALGGTGPTVKPITELLASAEATEGQRLFEEACDGCHTIAKGGPWKSGPNLWGTIGSKKAGSQDFSYSAAFARLTGTWTLPEFNAFIAAPTRYVPGTKMHSRGFEDPMERANLVSFLVQQADDPVPLPSGP